MSKNCENCMTLLRTIYNQCYKCGANKCTHCDYFTNAVNCPNCYYHVCSSYGCSNWISNESNFCLQCFELKCQNCGDVSGKNDLYEQGVYIRLCVYCEDLFINQNCSLN